MVEESKNMVDRVTVLIQDGKKILDREEKKSLYGCWTPDCMSSDHIKAIYKSWRKDFDEIIEELKANGIVIIPQNSAESEQRVLFFAKEKGYYKVKEYWQQHIAELEQLNINNNAIKD